MIGVVIVVIGVVIVVLGLVIVVIGVVIVKEWKGRDPRGRNNNERPEGNI